MISSSLLSLALWAGSTLAIGPIVRNCGTPPAPLELLKAHSALLDDPSRLNLLGALQDQSRSISVQTYFHVISAQGEPASATNITVNKQLQVMNRFFASQGISFTLGGIDYTVNTTWAADGDDATMKQKLHKGNYRVLNLYIQPSLGGNAIGRCTLPAAIKQSSNAIKQDGCNIDSHTLPGGAYDGYNQGKTAVHEVGHWFGLLHTFEGGCSGKGDYVDDTPAEASPASGCPTGRNTCSGGGADPIENFMDYSTDPCMTKFTRGQGSRMGDMFRMYRA